MSNPNPLAEVHPGQRLDGIPATAWNSFLRGIGPTKGDRPAGSRQATETLVLIRNDTGGDLGRHKVVKIGDVVNTPAVDADLFAVERWFAGELPAEGVMFGITQEPIEEDGIGLALVLGVTTCTLNVADAADTHASPTSSTDDLGTGTSGPAVILWKESGTGAGKKAKVLITQAGAAGSLEVDLDGCDLHITSSGTDIPGSPVDICSTITDPNILTAQLSVGSFTLVGGNRVLHDTDVLTLPTAGYWQVILNLHGDVGVSANVEITEETYGGGPAAGTATFRGPGADNSAAVGFHTGPKAWWFPSAPSGTTAGKVFTTYVGTTLANVRLGINIVTGYAAPSISANVVWGTTLTAWKMHEHI